MRSEARLDSAVFQLTPTRTRFELVITANGKSEKLASGLLNPFLAHLKAAQEQIAKGGYSITLEPDSPSDAFWFTKGAVERFVRFVSTPEILERVTTIESEILQIEDAITIQGNDNLGLSSLENHQTKPAGYIEGSKPVSDADAEKAIVLYKPGSQPSPPDSNGSAVQEENSKVQLLRVLETRKVVLQKEQGMAFARATAAGFDMDHLAYLVTFSESFGASRLKEACIRFMELWRVKHETGQWIEVEAAEAMSTRSGFSPFNISGIVLAGDTRKQKEFGEAPPPASGGDLGTEGNENDAATDYSTNKKLPQGSPGQNEYFQGQLQHPTFPLWAMHPPSGPPVFQPYPMQGMPYYQNYPGSAPFYQPPYPPVEDPRFSTHKRIGRRHSMTTKYNDVDSESCKDDADQSLSESEKEASHGRKSYKRVGRLGKKNPGVVVIENINVKSKKHEKSGDESESVSTTDTETEDSHSDDVGRKHKKSSRSSKKNEDRKKSPEYNSYGQDEVVYGNDADSGNWQAFQSFLLRAEEKMTTTVDGDMFTGEKEPKIKSKQNLSEAEPSLTPERDSGITSEARIVEFDSMNGKGSRARKVTSNDELLTSSEGRAFREGHLDAQFLEVEGGGGGYRRVTCDDFMIYGQGNQISSMSSSDPFSEHGYEHSGNLGKSSYVATDESFIVPIRSGSQGQPEMDNRSAIDMDLEFPSSLERKDSSNNGNNQLNYEPSDLIMMPERAIESEYVGYDPAIDYDMEVPVGVAAKQETRDQEDVSTSTKEELKKSNKEKKLKAPQSALEKRKKDALMRRGTPLMSSPLTEAQKRAEKLRAYKVDLQRAKKANEEEERKRLEALKIERQNRIAARTTSNSVHSPLAAKKIALSTKVSPSSFKGSKFSDAEPGLKSPIQKLPIRSSSIGSNDFQKTAKTSRSIVSANGLTKSVSSLPELKKEINDITSEAKAVAPHTKRLSDPNVRSVQHAPQTSVATDQMPKRNFANGSQMKKISAIVQLDKTKSATLPELKIRTSRGPSGAVQSQAITKELTQQEFGNVRENKTNDNPPRVGNTDDNPLIEKTVVILKEERISSPALPVSEDMGGTTDDAKLQAGPDSEHAANRAPPLPIIMRELEDPNQHKPNEQVDCDKVVNGSKKDKFQNISQSLSGNYYQAPFARATSVDDPDTSNLERTGALNMQSELTSNSKESIKVCVSDFSDSCLIDQANGSVERPRNKEPKGFRKLLKFGKKSHISALGEGNVDSYGSAANETEVASSNDVHILKNLISQDGAHSGGTPPKVHRPFSILSPFRSSKSSEKKLAAGV
ncbi:uncharacterized protein LOC109825853 [Asparagus officinalis]|uniref:uncharacterized protein LOC109825853 n=1 Tax=Asparagus officinalis TaxID=4686 RepID=UPI00098E66B7|nr:uncharacterized protein LOC109825853 [Asparagus officinalis]